MSTSGLIPSGNIFKVGLYTFLVGAAVFITALSWQSAFSSTINRFVKQKNTFWFYWLYAIILTFVFIIIIYYLAKILHQKVQFHS